MLPNEKLAVLIDHDIFGRTRRRRRFMKFKNAVPLHDLDALKPGDFVVHVDHGIGRYVGLTKIAVGGVQREVLKIEYRDGVNLFVKLENLSSVQKYSGREGFQPPISKIGGREWKEMKRRTKKSLVSIAEDLLKLQAKRKIQQGIAYPPDTPWQREMEASFPYEDTPDQMLAADSVKKDMEAPIPMDRLVCGDVGYGKTEVAMRAAFKAVADGKQVAVLVPTTILAQQHYRTFRERLKAWPMNVQVMSRFQSPKEQKETLKLLESGEVDVLIGTHRILSKDVKFHDLGLLIIDEEHRFGVVQKEKIKSLAVNIDVLSMSATPIPRTLHMALMGARDLSQIKTPPPGRLPIETDVVPFSDKVIKDAIIYELHRGGQVFFVHNRVQSILQMKDHLQELLPKVKFGVAHGQMDEKELSRVMVDFMEGRFDVLISTMIIESGLDMPRVNTMIINRADRLGVAQLHQLRGRIGRSSRKAYAYLMVPPKFEMSRMARERLAALTNFSSLGAGFQVAMRDLEIRGAGNLLGREQSGFINAIGFEMYQRLIEEAVREVQLEYEESEILEKPKELKLKLDTDAFFPDDYVSEGGMRLNFYRELSRSKELERVEEIAQDVQDRFGRFPDAARNLFDLVRMRILGERLGAESIYAKPSTLAIEFPSEGISRERILELVEKSEGFPIEFNAVGAVTIKLPLSKMESWQDKLSYAVKYLTQVARNTEDVVA
jgi:transcription-repair coupling factor (superfamily II helicase)